MRIYEVKVELVSMDWGRHIGWERVALTANKERAEEIRAAKVAEIDHPEKAWWCGVGADENGKPNVVVEDLGEVVE